MESQVIRVTVNGVPTAISPDQTIATFLQTLNLPLDRIAVELNKSIVRKRDWDHTTVPDQSNIEIVEFVGGG